MAEVAHLSNYELKWQEQDTFSAMWMYNQAKPVKQTLGNTRVRWPMVRRQAMTDGEPPLTKQVEQCELTNTNNNSSRVNTCELLKTIYSGIDFVY